jgi:hypothetical protein
MKQQSELATARTTIQQPIAGFGVSKIPNWMFLLETHSECGIRAFLSSKQIDYFETKTQVVFVSNWDMGAIF